MKVGNFPKENLQFRGVHPRPTLIGSKFKICLVTLLQQLATRLLPHCCWAFCAGVLRLLSSLTGFAMGVAATAMTRVVRARMVLESILKILVLELKLPDRVDVDRIGLVVLLLWMMMLKDTRDEGSCPSLYTFLWARVVPMLISSGRGLLLRQRYSTDMNDRRVHTFVNDHRLYALCHIVIWAWIAKVPELYPSAHLPIGNAGSIGGFWIVVPSCRRSSMTVLVQWVGIVSRMWVTKFWYPDTDHYLSLDYQRQSSTCWWWKHPKMVSNYLQNDAHRAPFTELFVLLNVTSGCIGESVEEAEAKSLSTRIGRKIAPDRLA